MSAVAGLLEALRRIGKPSTAIGLVTKPTCDVCLRLIADCDGSVHADRCPGKVARAAIKAWEGSLTAELVDEVAELVSRVRNSHRGTNHDIAEAVITHVLGRPTTGEETEAMSDTGAFLIGAGIALAGFLIAHGLDSIGDAIRKLTEKL